MNAPPRSEPDPLHPVGLRDFNRSDPAVAAALLRPCLDVDRWVASLVDGRPYAEGNQAYEQRFGRVFLIRAAGRSSADILAQLHTRLADDPDTEDEVVADQLRQIALVRLAGVIST